ncbi:MAG TPA: adenylate/guanylate cyclase domain-containing protein [Lacunisphaera sp.]|nr:adenylate/guanylate cyclase domain-containing protein [Lacunisphaera sp.]
MAPTPRTTLRQTWWIPLLCFGAAFWLAQTETLYLAEVRTLDWRTRYRTIFQPPPDPRIAIALFEDSTEANVAPWPVDRAWHGQLNKYLALEKAAVVAWDVILDTGGESEGDRAMAVETGQAIAAGTKVVTAASSSRGLTDARPRPTDPTQPLTAIAGDRNAVYNADHGLLLPYPRLRAACWWGIADAPQGPDGIVREIPLIVRIGDAFYPSLALQTLLVYLQVPPAEVHVKLGDAITIPAKDRTWRIPIDHRGWFLLNYRYDQPPKGRPDFPTYNYVELLVRIHESRVEKKPGVLLLSELAGKIVFVGQTVTGKADAGPTPLGSLSPLVLIHANLLNNILADDYARRAPDWLPWGLILLISYGAIAGLAHRSVIILCGGSLLVAVGYGAIALWGWTYGNWWLPVTGPLLGYAAVQFAIIGRRILVEQRGRREIQAMFGTYVSPVVIERLLASGRPPELGGHEEVITAYFSDIQGFSGFSEALPPARLGELMNEYFTACTDILQEDGGTLNEYAGDAAVVMFGAPIALPDHASRACLAALRVQHRLGELRAKWQAEGTKWPPVVHAMRSRIGLNTGPCVVGNMGSRVRFHYSMMGDNVNLAARMETGAKHWGVYTMCSEATRQACEQHSGDRVVFRPLGRIVVKGRSQPVPIHEIVGLKENLSAGARECLVLFAQGLERYHARDWAGARACFERSAPLEPNQPGREAGITGNPSLVYLDLVDRCSRQPPPPDWDGVYHMTEK